MATKRKKTEEKELERSPEELRKDQIIVKSPPIDYIIDSEIRNLEKVCATCSEIRPNIPDELVIDILLRLPGNVLYNVMRLVCKSWLNIINDPDFVSTHAHRSACTGFLSTIDYHPGPSAGYFLEIGDMKDNGQGKRKKEKIFHIESTIGIIIGSCDGIVLIRESINNKGNEQYRILNPVTREVVTYPLPKYDVSKLDSGGIEYARSIGKYKVVHRTIVGPGKDFISILTLGVDNTWRRIEGEEINNSDIWRSYGYALSVGGFIYWLAFIDPVPLALDIEDETLHLVHTPFDQHSINQRKRYTTFIKSESFLVFVLWKRKAIYDFWALVNPKTGDWEKLYQIKLNGEQERDSLCRLIGPCSNKSGKYSFRPCIILNDDIVIFYDYKAGIYIGYKVKTGAMFQYGKKDVFNGPRTIPRTEEIIVHRQTLVRLK